MTVHPEASAAEHLFRHEAGRLIPTLARILGVHNLALAEDVVQDVLCRALETWKFAGVPDNPAAWLTRAARNRALDVIRRERTARRFAPDLEAVLSSEWSVAITVDELFAEHEIRDDQLRMMFSCCSADIEHDAQVALVLAVLCGFDAGELASAFFTSRAAMEKRLSRAKDALRTSGPLFEFDGSAHIVERLDAVHRVLCLLFNEGYHSTHADVTVREDLVREALRLALLLASHRTAGTPSSLALAALLCLHAARLPARVDGAGKLVLLEDQDRALWDADLISRGLDLLERSRPDPALGAVFTGVSEYHVEAALASEHCLARSIEETDWERIVSLYDLLLLLRPSPVVALNRAIAIGRHEGPDRGLEAPAAIDGRERLSTYPFLLAAQGDLLARAGRSGEASARFREAALQARSSTETEFFERRAAECADGAARPASD